MMKPTADLLLSITFKLLEFSAIQRVWTLCFVNEVFVKTENDCSVRPRDEPYAKSDVAQKLV